MFKWIKEMRKFEKVLNKSKAFNYSETFNKFVEKLTRKYGRLSEMELIMLRETFDFAMSYKEKN